MRLAVAFAALPLVLVAGAGAAGNDTSLKATVWPKGEGTAARAVHTLRCDPPRGSVPRPAAACRAVSAAGRASFRPVPPDTACTEIYGGPAVAVVTGRLDGRRVWARFTRENGCQIERWQRLVPLLGRAGLVR
jgi:Subtilisin inhibitor-like